MHSERAPLFLKVAAWGGVIFLHFPLLIIAIYAFNTEDAAFSFPPQGLTLKWFSVAAGRGDIIESVTLSLQIAALSTAIALVLGTLAAAALWRSDFFGKNAISLLLLLPIALPGIITGLALLTAFKTINLEPGFFTIVVGHATFCVVVVFNNVIARFRRTSWSLVEASMDLGWCCPIWVQHFWRAECWPLPCRLTKSSSQPLRRDTSARYRCGCSISSAVLATCRSPTLLHCWSCW